MAANAPNELSTAAAQGDLFAVTSLIARGADVNKRSKDGMSPLSISAFWGYADICKILLEHRADINAQNTGTKWTALHCAAFQGHGPVVMKLMQKNPDISMEDMHGRTAADFASALDSIWPFFASMGCKRTPKSCLIQMDIVQKVHTADPTIPDEDYAHFSRPGSSYAIRSQMAAMNIRKDPDMETAAVTGDVLASLPEEPLGTSAYQSNRLQVWDN